MATGLTYDAVTSTSSTSATNQISATDITHDRLEPAGSNLAATQLNSLETTAPHESTATTSIPLEEQRTNTSTRSQIAPAGPTRTDTTTAISQANALDTDNIPPVPALPTPAHTADDSQRPSITHTPTTGPAIGPSTDIPAPAHLLHDPEVHGPTLMINLLLTNGARHPFKLDSSYLTKRGVSTQSDDPFDLSVYQLKQLILREWRAEWEVKPSSPGAIRLIMLGKLLEDKAVVKDLRFNRDATNVVHMTVKPQEFVEDEAEGKGGKAAHIDRHGRDRGDRSPGCRRLVM